MPDILLTVTVSHTDRCLTRSHFTALHHVVANQRSVTLFLTSAGPLSQALSLLLASAHNSLCGCTSQRGSGGVKPLVFWF